MELENITVIILKVSIRSPPTLFLAKYLIPIVHFDGTY